jgi:signal recognition particle GTPase
VHNSLCVCFEIHAPSAGSDVVLIDTAGRMQNNENLMKALAKLIHINTPDLVRLDFDNFVFPELDYIFVI